MAENRELGIYNAMGPAKKMTMREMLEGIRSAIGSKATFTWVPADFLSKHGVRQWQHMPVWIAPRPQSIGFSARSNARAIAKGLTFRPLAVTARDTLAWNKTRPADQLEKLAQGAVNGLSAEKEKEVLDAWKQESKSGETR